jgi:hypothetical protein
MTSQLIDSLTGKGCPLTPPDWNAPKEVLARVQRELVRRRLVEQYSSNPLYQARAEKDPDYWLNFSMGRQHLSDERDRLMLSSVEAMLAEFPEMAEVLLIAMRKR